jgi:hypothetical protein
VVLVKAMGEESRQERREWLINSEPLSLSMPNRGKGRPVWMLGRVCKIHYWALLGRGRSSTRPEATSVASRVRSD